MLLQHVELVDGDFPPLHSAQDSTSGSGRRHWSSFAHCRTTGVSESRVNMTVVIGRGTLPEKLQLKQVHVLAWSLAATSRSLVARLLMTRPIHEQGYTVGELPSLPSCHFRWPLARNPCDGICSANALVTFDVPASFREMPSQGQGVL